tara:strand:+ start:5144 stop:6025 length:882 start_codon:yes stop_codon:yes gene_type:complete
MEKNIKVSVDTPLDVTNLISYLQYPFDIKPFQCYVSNSQSIFVPCEKNNIDYYGIELNGFLSRETIQKNTIICAIESTLFNEMKKIALYLKCKTLNSIRKEDYLYIRMLGESLAELNTPVTISKPCINDDYNCTYQWFHWNMEVGKHMLRGKTKCLIATRDIKKGEIFLNYLIDRCRIETMRNIIERYPIAFKIGTKFIVSNDPFNSPVLLNGTLVNYLFVLDKNKKDIIMFDEDMSYLYKESNIVNNRKIIVLQHTNLNQIFYKKKKVQKTFHRKYKVREVIAPVLLGKITI